MARCLAVVMSHAPGLAGTPSPGHCSSAATNASWARSSATPTSRTIRVRAAMIFGDSIRHRASIARVVSVAVTATDHNIFYLRPQVRAALCGLLISLFELCYVEFVHLQHRLHDSIGFFRIWIAHQLTQSCWYDLPRQSILIFQPSTSVFLALCRQLLPQLIHFCLGLAVHHEGNCGREREHRSAVQRSELLSVQLEGQHHHRAFW